jgi:hypothetical protein
VARPRAVGHFEAFALERERIAAELAAYAALLASRPDGVLEEARDVLPFFKRHRNLAALLGTYNPNIARFDRIAFEFNLFGDHRADLAVGDSANGEYCFIEFEDASRNSVFTRDARKTPKWSRRFEVGYSQLIDWILWLHNARASEEYKARFGVRPIQFTTLLIIGRDAHLDDHERERLAWRGDQVIVASRKVHCLTFDRLYRDLESRARTFGLIG